MTHLVWRRAVVGALAAGAAFAAALPATADGVVNVYTNREPGLYSATLDEFTKATGVKVNPLFSEQGLAERIRAEGENSPADVLITVDIGRLREAVDLGITQPVRSEILAANIPAQFRDPDWKGKICTRSFQHQYNIALVAAFLVKNGEARTEEWLRGVKANLAKRPSGGDRDVAKDIAAGACDIGLGNQYYVGLMTNGPAEQKKWAEAIRVILPTFKD